MRTLIGGLFLCVLAVAAHAHSFYPPNCCAGNDCMELASERVRITPGGYLIDNRETVPFDKAQSSPDEHYHGCFPPSMMGKVGCFWAPRPST